MRLALTATVTVLLITGSAVPAMGQEATDAHVTGSVTCWMTGSPTDLESGTLRLGLGQVRCMAEMSDARVSGLMEGEVQQVCLKEAGPNVCMQFGTVELQGPDGTWVGTWDAMYEAPSIRLPTWMITEGTGAYEGWTYMLFDPCQTNPTAEAIGIIYKGPPPPWSGSLPLAPAQ